MFDLRTEYKVSTQQLLDGRDEIIKQLNAGFWTLLTRERPGHFNRTIYGLELKGFIGEKTESGFPCHISLCTFASPVMYFDQSLSSTDIDTSVLVDQCILRITQRLVCDTFDEQGISLSDKIKEILRSGNWEQIKDIYPHCVIKQLAGGFNYHIGTLAGKVIRSVGYCDCRFATEIDKMPLKTLGHCSREVEHSSIPENRAFYHTPEGITSINNVVLDTIHDYLIVDLTLLHLRGDFNPELKQTAITLYKR